MNDICNYVNSYKLILSSCPFKLLMMWCRFIFHTIKKENRRRIQTKYVPSRLKRKDVCLALLSPLLASKKNSPSIFIKRCVHIFPSIQLFLSVCKHWPVYNTRSTKKILLLKTYIIKTLVFVRRIGGSQHIRCQSNTRFSQK